MSRKKIFDLGRPLIMGHRGDSTSAPENTMLAFTKAVEIGIDFLESDISMTKDDELVLFHDESVEDFHRVTGQSGRIRELTLDEARQLDIGFNFTNDGGQTYPCRGQGYGVVTVRELFEKFPNVAINMDLKTDELHASDVLMSLIKEYDRTNSIIVGSFHDTQISRFRKIYPDIPTAANPSEVTRFVFGLTTRSLKLMVRNPPYRAFQVPVNYRRINVVNERFVKAAHERNIAVHVWTINERTEMDALIDLGVDGIFTDNPTLLREVLIERHLILTK